MNIFIGLLLIAVFLLIIFRTIRGMIDDAKKRAEKKVKEIEQSVSDAESSAEDKKS